jgi:transcriptional regulator with XRE-family HTH domain
MAKIANGEYPRHVFARRLREARKRRGWDQKDLAAALSAIEYKLDVSQISKIEKGTRQVSV